MTIGRSTLRVAGWPQDREGSSIGLELAAVCGKSARLTRRERPATSDAGLSLAQECPRVEERTLALIALRKRERSPVNVF